jgi:hypothetical protein
MVKKSPLKSTSLVPVFFLLITFFIGDLPSAYAQTSPNLEQTDRWIKGAIAVMDLKEY